MSTSWEELAKNTISDPLAAIRLAAQNWATIPSALVGISTIIGLIQGRDALDKISLPYQIMLVAVFLIAFGLSLIAIYLAALAGEGTPGPVILEKDTFTIWYREAVQRSSNYLIWSRKLTLVTAFIFILGLFITWFAPGPPVTITTATNVLVIQKSGAFVCGTLVKDNGGKTGSYSLVANDKSISINNVVSFTVVSSCP